MEWVWIGRKYGLEQYSTLWTVQAVIIDWHGAAPLSARWTLSSPHNKPFSSSHNKSLVATEKCKRAQSNALAGQLIQGNALDLSE